MAGSIEFSYLKVGPTELKPNRRWAQHGRYGVTWANSVWHLVVAIFVIEGLIATKNNELTTSAFYIALLL